MGEFIFFAGRSLQGGATLLKYLMSASIWFGGFFYFLSEWGGIVWVVAWLIIGLPIVLIVVSIGLLPFKWLGSLLMALGTRSDDDRLYHK